MPSHDDVPVPAALLMLADGRFPSGGHANSAGAESAVACHDVVDAATLERFLRGRIATTGVTDAAFAARACAAVDGLNPFELFERLDAEYDARTASPRLRSVSRRLGRQLTRTAAAAWPHPVFAGVASSPEGGHHPIVLGVATAAAGASPVAAAALAFHHTAGTIATAGVRLLGLDPIEVSAVQARVATEIDRHLRDAAAWAVAAPGALPGFTGTLTEILGEAHGLADGRLFVA